ncbi:Hypothetical predicted protein [Mytilus galloprovincialis]|uniref:Uncharacterized protein n=1 Tax=Mytilus galloprovincialis TaxID=29158 RepID=A0A8B6H1S6_MYTGA|nr:Hypothetical predicted protein [Mytilus galloprovincialis]
MIATLRAFGGSKLKISDTCTQHTTSKQASPKGKLYKTVKTLQISHFRGVLMRVTLPSKPVNPTVMGHVTHWTCCVTRVTNIKQLEKGYDTTIKELEKKVDELKTTLH